MERGVSTLYVRAIQTKLSQTANTPKIFFLVPRITNILCCKFVWCFHRWNTLLHSDKILNLFVPSNSNLHSHITTTTNPILKVGAGVQSPAAASVAVDTEVQPARQARSGTFALSWGGDTRVQHCDNIQFQRPAPTHLFAGEGFY